MTQKKKIAFLLYYDWEKLFVSLDNDEDAGILIKALFAYVKRGEVAQFKGALKTAFTFIIDKIDHDSEKWADTCEKRRNAAKKRWDDMQSMQMHANACNSMQNMQMHARVGDNDYDNEYDYDNDYDNDNINNIKGEKATKTKETDLEKIICEYSDNEELQQALLFFVKTRKALKAPMTDRALTLSLNKLDKLGENEAVKIDIVNQSIERGWKSFFPVGETQTHTTPDNSADIEEYKNVINKFLY